MFAHAETRQAWPTTHQLSKVWEESLALIYCGVRQLAERLRSLWQRLRAKHTVTWRHVKGHSDNKWNDYVDELATRGRQGDRGSNAAEWADDTIPTDTPDEGSIAEGGDSSTIGHGAAGGGQDSERQDGSDTVRLWTCYTNGYNPS